MRRPARYFAKVCVFILPGANMANNRLEEDFRIAREVWGFDFDITVLKIDTKNPIFSNLSSRDFGCEGRGDTEVERLLFQLKSTYCPDPRSIAVFYTGTNAISQFIRACTKRRRVPNSSIFEPTFMNVIFVSNLFAKDSLAHELGHAFFFSNRNDRVDSDLNRPGIQTHVEGDPYNIMAPGHIRKFPTTATPDQIRRAIESNSPQVIFERTGTFSEDIHYVNPHHENQTRNRSYTPYRNPHDVQMWPGYYY